MLNMLYVIMAVIQSVTQNYCCTEVDLQCILEIAIEYHTGGTVECHLKGTDRSQIDCNMEYKRESYTKCHADKTIKCQWYSIVKSYNIGY